jgi:hypothetical protein
MAALAENNANLLLSYDDSQAAVDSQANRVVIYDNTVQDNVGALESSLEQ